MSQGWWFCGYRFELLNFIDLEEVWFDVKNNNSYIRITKFSKKRGEGGSGWKRLLISFSEKWLDLFWLIFERFSLVFFFLSTLFLDCLLVFSSSSAAYVPSSSDIGSSRVQHGRQYFYWRMGGWRKQSGLCCWRKIPLPQEKHFSQPQSQ